MDKSAIFHGKRVLRDVYGKRKRISRTVENSLIFNCNQAPRMLAAQRSSQMSQESKRTYTIRLPETVAARVEEQAASSGIAPTTLIQSLVADTCTRLGEAAVGGPASKLIGKLDALSKACERLEQNATERHTATAIRGGEDALGLPACARPEPERTGGGRDHRGVGEDRTRLHRSPRRRRRYQAMNAYVDRAVRRRADLASLHVWAQMALRSVLLIVASLGASDSCAGLVLDRLLRRSRQLTSTSEVGSWRGF